MKLTYICSSYLTSTLKALDCSKLFRAFFINNITFVTDSGSTPYRMRLDSETSHKKGSINLDER